ncbi:MAG: UDP-N-acetylmuramate--L-alanine ligase [Bacteroidales bacterium]|nr:UDP-N-acetylmuramate--L-alanine ligase [Bacteroidales bacterium]MEE3447051.1 UDP-N-acetylmuramate--L-alanine ligase [Bacteroidales bacterium]
MNHFDKINYIYFLGIGGIGMSALARYFNLLGKKVYGYDLTPSALTQSLESEGIEIVYNDDISLIPMNCMAQKEKTMVVFTPAVPQDNKIFGYFAGNRYFMIKRARVLGMISDKYNLIAVSGTHGKTTTSSVIANILRCHSEDSFAFLGGISKNLDSNLMMPKNKEAFENPETLLVAEADEFDRSFLWLTPRVSVITYVDADHLDIYKDRADLIATFNSFAQKGKKDGAVIVNKKIEELIDTKGIKKIIYSEDDKTADYYAENLRLEDGFFIIDAVTPKGVIKDIKIGARGRVNIENTMACIAATQLSGIDDSTIKKGVETFMGVKRRMDFHVQTSDAVYIDDYAHHPRELSATISSVRELFPGKKITGIFQPHLYTRTRDFATDFAKSLDLLDEVVLMDIYPAREKPIVGVDSKLIAGLMKNKNTFLINQKEKIIEKIVQEKPQVLLTLGAGSIDRLIHPLKQALEKDESLKTENI